MRRLAPVLVVVLVLAGCGGSSHTSTSGDRAAKVRIVSAYEEFFSPDTSLSDRIALLQNGSQFKSVIQAFASNPLASKASAKVSSVMLQGSNEAKVVYSVRLGSTSLGTQTGSAVRQNGTWKVGYASLCRLVALGGTLPPACKP